MDAFKILFAVVLCAASSSNAGPIKRYDQRQDGDLNIQAHLDKIVLLIIPSKNINILDIKGQGQFENYEDLLPLFGGKEQQQPVLSEIKLKSAVDLDKEKKTAIIEIKEDIKKDVEKKTSEKPEQKDAKSDIKKPTTIVEVTPKKVDIENKAVSEAASLKRVTPKFDGRTYQTVQSGNNRERVIAVSQDELKKQEEASSSATKIEKL